jgi:hypothetical protein
MRERRLDRSPQLDRQWRRLGLPERAARDVEVALNVEGPLARRLVRRRLADAVVDVVVELVDRDQAVSVAVGLAALEPMDDRRGEDRRVCIALPVLPFEGVLHRP